MLHDFSGGSRLYTCECGIRYRVHYHKTAMRHKDDAKCWKCDRLIISWNGGYWYGVEELPPKKLNVGRPLVNHEASRSEDDDGGQS